MRSTFIGLGVLALLSGSSGWASPGTAAKAKPPWVGGKPGGASHFVGVGHVPRTDDGGSDQRLAEEEARKALVGAIAEELRSALPGKQAGPLAEMRAEWAAKAVKEAEHWRDPQTGEDWALLRLKKSEVDLAPIELELSLVARRVGEDTYDAVPLDEIPKLRSGDSLRVVAKTNRASFLVVLRLDPSGKAVQLFPDLFSIKRDPLPARSPHEIPADGEWIGVEGGKPGRGELVVIASAEPIQAITKLMREMEEACVSSTRREVAAELSDVLGRLDAGVTGRQPGAATQLSIGDSKKAKARTELVSGRGIAIFRLGYERLP